MFCGIVNLMNTTELGRLGEDLAIKLLQEKGYKILFRNFRSKIGEIDIVAIDPSVNPERLVFVEVKTRWNREFGLPEEAITPRKIRSIARTGDYFKLLNPGTPEALRIDAVLAELDTDGKVYRLELVKNLTS